MQRTTLGMVLTEDKIIIGRGTFDENTGLIRLDSYHIVTKDGWGTMRGDLVAHTSQVKRLVRDGNLPEPGDPVKYLFDQAGEGGLVI